MIVSVLKSLREGSPRRLSNLVLVVWTLVTLGSLTLTFGWIEKDILSQATTMARTSFVRDLQIRRWATRHGGVYVPVGGETRPNPYLTMVKERDITTASGRQLTLLNPAYITRQIFDEMKKEGSLYGHITSLEPLNPANAPDPWERTALMAIRDGAGEVKGIQRQDGKEVMRLMRPLPTEKPCLNCHASQGYKVGDVRGGISVTVGMAPFRARLNPSKVKVAIGHLFMWALGVIGLLIARRQVLRREAARERAAQQLRDQEERYRSILQSTTDGFLVLGPEGRLLDVNDAYCEMSGHGRAKLLEMGLADLEASKTAEELQAQTRRIRQQGSDRFETTHRRADGSELRVEVSTSHLPDQGDIFFAFVNDITERRELEGQLRQAQKMEAVGLLAGGVAHDFNNQLQAIMGNAELALDDQPEGAECREDLEEILTAADRARALFTQLLAFSRKQMLKLQPLDLAEVVQELSRMVRRLIGEHIRLDIEVAPGLKAVYADQGQIEQVLLNLCVNARDAMEGGGEINVRLSNAALAEPVSEPEGSLPAGDYVAMEVQDTGAGMSPDLISRIWEPFFTTKESGRGTGLGLSTVYGIIRQHGGGIRVSSAPGEGTTFKILLPAHVGQRQDQSEPNASAARGGKETILLAEDNEGVRNLAIRLLERAGYTVLAAPDGEQGLALFEEHAHEVDMALLDVVMPGLSGPDLYRAIKEQHPEFRALFASGFKDSSGGSKFALDPGDVLIRKPYDRETLLTAVRQVLDN